MTSLACHPRVGCLVAVLLAVLAVGIITAEEAPRQDANAVGLTLQFEPGPDGARHIPRGIVSPTAATPFYIVIRPRRAGLDDPAKLDSVLDAAREAGMRVVVRINRRELRPDDPASEKWFEQVAALAQHAGDRIAAWQVLDTPAHRYLPETYAYVLKRFAVIARAAHGDVRVVSGPIRAGDEEWAAELLKGDVGLYVDVLAAEGFEALDTVRGIRDAHHPAAATWVGDAKFDPYAPRSEMTRHAVESFAGGAEAVVFEEAPDALPGVPVAPRSLRALLADLGAMLPSSMGLAAEGALPFDPAEGEGVEWTPFLDADKRAGVVAYRNATEGAKRTVTVSLRSPVLSVDLYDPIKAEAIPLGHERKAGDAVEIPVRNDFQLLRYRLSAGDGSEIELSSASVPQELLRLRLSRYRNAAGRRVRVTVSLDRC
jgi:hypothetical protein